MLLADGFNYDITSYTNINRWREEAKAELSFYDEIVGPALVALKAFVGYMKSQTKN